jgi:hypothetical protein
MEMQEEIDNLRAEIERLKDQASRRRVEIAKLRLVYRMVHQSSAPAAEGTEDTI